MNKRKLKKFAKKKGLPIPFSIYAKQKKKKMLVGGQAKLDKNKNNFLDESLVVSKMLNYFDKLI